MARGNFTALAYRELRIVARYRDPCSCCEGDAVLASTFPICSAASPEPRGSAALIPWIEMQCDLTAGRLSYGWTAGSVDEPEVLIQVGWPKPPALRPVPPFGFGVMSKTMLSGRTGSPDTPPTAGKEPEAAMWSSPRRFRTRQAMLWSAQEVSPLTPTPPTITCPRRVERESPAKHVDTADLLSNHRVRSGTVT